MNIKEMKAGRELDALVAEKVMGFPKWRHPMRFSTDIAAAWLVVEWMMESDLWWGDIFLEWWQDGEWLVCNKPVSVRDGAIKANCDGRETGKPSLPLAICLAALKAVEEA